MRYPHVPLPAGLALFLVFVLLVSVPASAADVDDLVSQRPPGEGPTRIEVSFYLIDLMKVIDVNEMFEADMFFIASWHDPRLAGDRVRVVPVSEVWMPDVLVFNKRDADADLPNVVAIQPDGSVAYRQRMIGTFASPLDLRRFPLDSQTLHVQLVVYGAGTDEVIMVESPGLGVAANPDLSIGDWKVGPARMERDEFRAIPGGPPLSRLTVTMDVERLVGYYIVQMLVPLLLIMAMAWMPFWINPEVIPTRVGTSVTTVLTLIAYRFMLGALVPKLSYLTLMDYLLLGATLVVAASLVTVATGSTLVKTRPQTVRRIDRIGRVAYPLVFISLIAVIYLFG